MAAKRERTPEEQKRDALIALFESHESCCITVTDRNAAVDLPELLRACKDAEDVYAVLLAEDGYGYVVLKGRDGLRELAAGLWGILSARQP